jgi:hypothetical protein
MTHEDIQIDANDERLDSVGAPEDGMPRMGLIRHRGINMEYP